MQSVSSLRESHLVAFKSLSGLGCPTGFRMLLPGSVGLPI